MSDWLNNGTTGNGTKDIYSIQNGEEESHTFSSNTNLKDAVKAVANQKGYASVLVKIDGRTADPSEGGTSIASLGRIEILPKFVGA